VGYLKSQTGRKRDELEAWFYGPDGPSALFAGRILAFDETAALAWARLMAEGTRKGKPRSALDTIIAATALVNNCIVATDNEKDFDDIAIVNPL
jgi:toxin FitB